MWVLLLLFCLGLSAMSIAIYAHEIPDDIATAVGVGSYVATCLSIVIAFLAAGAYIGATMPEDDAFKYKVHNSNKEEEKNAFYETGIEVHDDESD
jgi:hypothetical protein